MKLLKILFFFIIGCITVSSLQAQSVLLSDSAKVSLLTNSPWSGKVYAVFGHTAVRVSDQPNGIDWVFNYGIFDFDTPNFIFRFATGETDYILAAYPFASFMEERRREAVASYEQQLNLTQTEKQRIWDALCINALPENREYRYNFFFDNCATRPRDIVEQHLTGKIMYTSTGKVQTFRDLLHECVSAYPWLMFGIDLVIGSEADKEITDREKMFLPIYLKHAYDGAVIVLPEGSERPLVADEYMLMSSAGNDEGSDPVNYPVIAGVIVFVLAIVVSYLSYRNYMLPGRIFDVLLFAVAGVAGCIIAFLMFFSEHPAVSPNWNLVWLNPVQLIIAILIPIKYFSKAVYYYHFINFVVLSLFMALCFLLPQQFEAACFLFIGALWMRCGTPFVLNYCRNKRKV